MTREEKDFETYRAAKALGEVTAYFYALLDPRNGDDIPAHLLDARQRITRIGAVGSFHPDERPLTRVMYKRMEAFKRQLDSDLPSRENRWLKNLLDNGLTPIVRVTFVWPNARASEVRPVSKRLAEGHVYSSTFMQPVEADIATPIEKAVQGYLDNFFSTLRQPVPEPTARKYSRSYRRTVATLNAQLEALTARIEKLEEANRLNTLNFTPAQNPEQQL